ncbi:CLUMA_CG002886, isoform A [Clunio marinus]|uniref:CLUMA_CG002886, isoform A n=1 Tax=Clunio marinus TaxID=568069 RepID=A0A1J1HQK5_9DIPT|nr:CLUMA_CG002886, isoform A [Clunio marinus]
MCSIQALRCEIIKSAQKNASFSTSCPTYHQLGQRALKQIMKYDIIVMTFQSHIYFRYITNVLEMLNKYFCQQHLIHSSPCDVPALTIL